MPQKENPRQITVSDMSPHVHSFGIGENKVNKISKWLVNWIETSLETGKIKPYDFLPSKGDLAFHIGVSKGTIQNVYRFVEDYGLIESKQKIGTYIKCNDVCTQKLTSKREQACETIKKYLIDSGYDNGDNLIPIRRLSLLLDISPSTIRTAFNSLIAEGILSKKDNTFFVNNINFTINKIKAETLAEKIAKEIKEYVKNNHKKDSKLPSNIDFAAKYNVSIKTINEAIKLLTKEGILYTRRGTYGTIINSSKKEIYYYEQAESKIKTYILQNCSTGDKLPSVRELAKYIGVSTKTIKNALDNLAEDGYVTFSRGRLGGTFVLEIPAPADMAYTWLAINPHFIPNIDN